MSDFYCDEILTGRHEVEVVLDTEGVLAFRHTRPAYEKHVVVIPKQHVPSLVDLGSSSEKLLTGLIATVRQLAGEMLEREGACRVITNLGSYQDTKHLHFHVVSGEAQLQGPSTGEKG
jgi:histidine triad (HIT) family protein